MAILDSNNDCSIEEGVYNEDEEDHNFDVEITFMPGQCWSGPQFAYCHNRYGSLCGCFDKYFYKCLEERPFIFWYFLSFWVSFMLREEC